MATSRTRNASHRPDRMSIGVWSVGLSASLLLLVMPAAAQYKVVGPDGKVTYTDRPPVGSKAQPIGNEGVSDGSAGASNLPYELKQVVSRFPVTLYTSTDCSPCDDGRALLKQRGVPFTEHTVTTNDDSAALRRIEGVDSVPVLRIGGQQLKGFSASDWNGYLTAAGYPAKSALPANYSSPAPTPLAPKTSISNTPSTPQPSPAPSPSPSNGSAPPGFRF